MKINVLALTAVSVIAFSAGAMAAAPKFGSWGYDATAMDSGVKPGDDFFDYVNGAWFKRTDIAADRTFAGIDSVLNDQIEKDVRAIVEDQAKNPGVNGQLGQQIGDLYASWMDEAAIEQRGTAPLRPYLDRVAAAKTRADLVDLFAEPGFDSPVGIFIYPDLKNPTRYAAYASQSGLGMPNRDDYLLKGAKDDAYRKA
jgi:endothelin-converting enzyme/putative endopeptidase